MYTFIKKHLRLELKSPYNVKSYVQPKVRKYVVNPKSHSSLYPAEAIPDK